MVNRDKFLIKVLLLLSSFGLLYYIALPLYSGGGKNILDKDNILSLSSNIKKADDDIKKGQTLIAWLKKTNEDYLNITKQSKDRLSIAIKQDMDLLRTFNDLIIFFKKRGVDISLPEYSEDKSKNDTFKVYTYRISAKSDYYNFLELIKDINNSLQIYNIKSLSLSPTQNPMNNTINYSLVLENYQHIK